MKGSFYIQAGPSLNTHHRWAVPEEFALDIVQIGEGVKTYRGSGTAFTDYLIYGQPVYAVADGEVVKIVSNLVEDPAQFRGPTETQEAYFERIQGWQAALLSKGVDAAGGNLVVIKHPWGEYSVYAHLKPGAAPVKVGDVVKAGTMIGWVGSSGSSTEPHLHFHICDGPSALECAGRPAAFSNVENPFAFLPGPIQSGDIIVTK
jgi:murein DD-endopeptidase MepM/ murein hydrolase activator NlpD